jgi:predicted deacylase
LETPRNTVEARRTREIRPLLDSVDYLLDIHSMQHPTQPLMLAGPLDKGRALAERVGVPAAIVMDQGHAAGRRMRDYGPFRDPAQTPAALLVECGQHWASASIDVARQTMVRFLVATGAAAPSMIEEWLGDEAAPAQRVIEVTDAITVENANFAFVAPYIGMEVIPKAGTLLAMDGDTPIHTPHDNCVLIMPSRRLSRGQTAVRLGRFID